MFERLGRWLGRFLEVERATPTYVSQDFEALSATIRVGDVLLVEGQSRVSGAIKYLTQSTWSHAALCVAAADAPGGAVLVEVTLNDGCHRLPLARYQGYNTRLCRAVGLSPTQRQAVADYMTERLGLRYDTRNVIDLARYLLPTPPVPRHWRRRMLAFGSGDPTRAICSSLIAQAFQSVPYPILPEIRMIEGRDPHGHQRREVWHIRHHSLFTPRDFDISPYFEVVKPTIVKGFDPGQIPWAKDGEPGDFMG
jgi:hypothetical protein